MSLDKRGPGYKIYSDPAFCVYCVLQNEELKNTISELESERDFYFSKLRDIELQCQENEDNPVVPIIMEIMYATQVHIIRKLEPFRSKEFVSGFGGSEVWPKKCSYLRPRLILHRLICTVVLCTGAIPFDPPTKINISVCSVSFQDGFANPEGEVEGGLEGDLPEPEPEAEEYYPYEEEEEQEEY